MAQIASEALEYGGAPSVLVFADNGAAIAAAEQAIAAAGGRVGAALPVDAALERIETHPGLAALLIELLEDGGERMDALFDALDAGAAEGRFASVVIVPLSLLDVASARLRSEGVILLCEPDATERSDAIAAALSRRSHNVAETGPVLRQLAEEVTRIARTLEAMAREEGDRGGAYRGGAKPADDVALIKGLIRARRLRSQFFPADLFADPAWDMLLDLMTARLEGRGVAVSSLCIASEVPPTTALRWINTMTEANLFTRVADSKDGRRVFIELTDVAERAMAAYLAGLQRTLTLNA